MFVKLRSDIPKWLLMLLAVAGVATKTVAQRFYNLTAQEVSTQNGVPRFAVSLPLHGAFTDSLYTVVPLYPEFIDMPQTEIQRFKALTSAVPPAFPVVNSEVVVTRKTGALEVDFCPVVFRENRWQLLVGFQLQVSAHLNTQQKQRMGMSTRASSADQRYANHSVLANGKWVKIKVSKTGVHQITAEWAKKQGFNSLEKLKIYGYGGALQNEKLVGQELQALDDLPPVPTYTDGQRKLFYAKGPVSWANNTTLKRTRNPYADEGYYFITEEDVPATEVDSTAFLNHFYPAPHDYHVLYEVDNYSWYDGGRNLFDKTPIEKDKSVTFSLDVPNHVKQANISVAVTANAAASCEVWVNDSLIGRTNFTWNSYNDEYNHGKETYINTYIYNVQPQTQVKIVNTGANTLRLDYISMAFAQPQPAPRLASTTFPAPQVVETITPQDLHAHGASDMVIIIPTSKKLLSQATRLADFHRKTDNMRVQIIPANQLYNEFSSGTPDANAYRRYLKMLYDRAQTQADMPRYLVLFGDCAWDNRMNTEEWQGKNVNDYLLCYESENSFNAIYCYVDDGWFTLLDDGEGVDPKKKDKQDVAVGRIPATTDEDARIVVDKTLAYATNNDAGEWQNNIMFMGDDGNAHLHMNDAQDNARLVENMFPGYNIKRVMWDAYKMERTIKGVTYPGATADIKAQQSKGALIMNYSGHGRWDQLSDENVLNVSDFEQFKNTRLPLWITASCDIMPFDGIKANMGEAALFNKNGGAVAFYGTTRTVYADRNKIINQAFLRHLLNTQQGKAVTLGEAQRLAKNELIATNNDSTVNKLQYSLLGDPALALHVPTREIVLDSVNHLAVNGSQRITLKPGTVVRLSGHIAGNNNFNGVVSVVVKDALERITTLSNQYPNEAGYTYYDRKKTLFSGTDSVRNGRFSAAFTMPVEMGYTSEAGLITLFATNSDGTESAHGQCTQIYMGSANDTLPPNNGIGPSVFCYLNSPQFSNGDRVNATPLFVAELMDADGINTSGNGIGHDLQLCIDDDATQTYVLNNQFSYQFGSYTQGTVTFQLPQLADGEHKLTFKAWDTFNNPTVSQLKFVVQQGLSPRIFSIDTTQNPAANSTTFIVSHDRAGSLIDVEIEVFNLQGVRLWHHSEQGVSSLQATTVPWNLCNNAGAALPNGLYLYRVKVSSEGKQQVSKAKKLVIANNK